MEHITTTQYAKALGEHPMKIKRHARELFGYDEVAGRRTGYARQLSVANDCLPLGLFTYLVSHQKCSIPDAKAIIKDLKPILKELKILPLSYQRWRRFEFDAPIKDWTIEIDIQKSGLFFYVTGVIKGKISDEIIEGYSGWVEQRKEFHQRWYKGKLLDLKDGIDDDTVKVTGIELSFFTHFFVDALKDAGHL